MLVNQTLNTHSNSKMIVYNIFLSNNNRKLGSKNQRGDPCICFCPGADGTKGDKSAHS
jgi:hypothetical protein